MAHDTPQERILYIACLMAENKWPAWPDSVPFRKALAVEWGCAETTIRGYAAEAHRTVAMDPDDRLHLQQEIARRMKRIADDAETAKNTITGLPDYGSAIKAMNMYAKYSGIELEQKVKVSGTVKLTELDELKALINSE